MRAGTAEDAASFDGAPIVTAGEQTVAGRSADGAGTVSVQEVDAFVGHRLQVWGLDLAVGIARCQVADAHVVSQDDDDVWLVGRHDQVRQEE